jgi:hypothetical protein
MAGSCATDFERVAMQRRNHVAMFLVVIVVGLLGACKTMPEKRLSEAEILKLAEAVSYEDCHTGSSHGYKVVGCDLDALFMDGNWSVIATKIFKNEKGERLGVMGAGSAYVFSPDGKYLSHIPGM